MKPTIAVVLLMATLCTTSCGLSEKQKTALLQAQQAKDDSIRLAQVNQIKDSEALRSAISDSLSRYNALLTRQQTALIQLRTDIYTANDQMTEIRSFHFGRMPADKEAQIRNQELKIQTLIVQQSNLQTAIQQTTTEILKLRSALIAAK